MSPLSSRAGIILAGTGRVRRGRQWVLGGRTTISGAGGRVRGGKRIVGGRATVPSSRGRVRGGGKGIVSSSTAAGKMAACVACQQVV